MKIQELTSNELNKLSKDDLIMMHLQLLNSFSLLTEQTATTQKKNEELLKQVENLKEQVAILTQHRFGRKTESSKQIQGQLAFDLENYCILNEAEVLTEYIEPEEPSINTVVRRPRQKGKRAINLKDIEVEVITHECSDEELRESFPAGWHALQDEVYSELQYIPARFKVLEHHICVYAGNKGVGSIRRAASPERLLSHSILTPELAAAIFNAKYVNAVPLNRLSEEFLRNDVNIPRQDMAGWMIRIADYYLKPIHLRMKAEILSSSHVHCDETPFVMPEHSKEYMWVFHSPGGENAHQVFLYEFLGKRNGGVIEEYLKGYKGTLITDGYQPYHSLARKSDTIRVAGCWAHARRKFAEIIKAAGKTKTPTPAVKIATEAVKRIDAIYHVDNTTKTSSASERLENRQQKAACGCLFSMGKNIQGQEDHK